MAKLNKEALSERDIEVRAIAEAELEALLSKRLATSETEEPEEEKTETEESEEEQVDEKAPIELPQRKPVRNSK